MAKIGYGVKYGFNNDFVELLADLKEKYGEKIFEIHGIGDKNLDITSFPKDFYAKSTNVAAVSIDDNANVNEKTLVQYRHEKYKAQDKMNSIYMLYKWVKKLFSKKDACNAIEAIISGKIFVNDLTGIEFPYSYYEQTSITIRVNGQIKTVTMLDLFNYFKEFIEIYPDREVIKTNNLFKEIDYLDTLQIGGTNTRVAKRKLDYFNPEDKIKNIQRIEVLDGSGEWVGLKQILRHEKHNSLLIYQTEAGDFAMVTEDHPVILDDGTEINAGELQIGMQIKKEEPVMELTETVEVSQDMAYIIGFLLGDGNISRHKFYQGSKNILDTSVALNYDNLRNKFTIYQKDIENSVIYNKIRKVFPELPIQTIHDGNAVNFCSTRLKLIMSELFGIDYGNSSFRKSLPNNILDWKKSSIEALICGLIDSDGTVTPNQTINLRMKAYALITQLYDVLRTIGISSRKCFHEKSEMFGIVFAPSKEMYLMSYKLKGLEYKEYNDQYNTCGKSNKVIKVYKMADNKLLPNGEDIYHYVYDITTESGTFYANGMLQHNCYAFDLMELAEEGLTCYSPKKIKAPKRGSSFIELIIQATAYISNQIMGAVSYPSLFPILDWYYRHDFGENYADDLKSSDAWNNSLYGIKQQFQSLIYSFNFNAFRAGGQTAFTNLSVLDRGFLKQLFSEYYMPDCTPTNIESTYKLSKAFFEYFTEIQASEGVFTFPVMTLATSLDENNNYMDPEFIDWMAEVNYEKSVGNIFQSAPTRFSSCCRLVNDYKAFEELGFSNSFGVGGLSIGSLRVCGINMARLGMSEVENADELKNLLDLVHKILYAHRQLVKERISLGVMPLYTSGWININKQFSTIGMLGCNEYLENKGLNILTEEGQQVLLDRFSIIAEEAKKWTVAEISEHNVYNIEVIPGESQAVKLADIDKELGLNPNGYKLYSNQYVPLIKEASIYDRCKIQGIYDKLSSGGSILHITHKEKDPLTKEQYKKLILMTKDLGVSYFAINYAYSICENNHLHIGDIDKCPVCGSENISKYMRVSGFITPVNSWNPVRKNYEYKRRVSYGKDCFDEENIKSVNLVGV